MLDFNFDSAPLGTSNQLNDIVNLLETGLGNQQGLFPQLDDTLMSGGSSFFDFLGGGEEDDVLDGGITDTIKINNPSMSFDSLTFDQIDGNTTISEQGNPLAVNKDSLTPESFIFSDDAIANQFHATAGSVIPISTSPSTTPSTTPGTSQNLPSINFSQIEQFISNYLSQLLNTPLQDFLTLFTSGAPNTQSQSISISGYSTSGDAITADNSYAALENRQYNFARSYVD